jgi:fermentation-respiration switch protein FrsA (DUF1100 family)
MVQFRYDTATRLANDVTCPLLLLHGQRDATLSYRHSDRLLEATIRGWRMRVGEGADGTVCVNRSVVGGDGFEGAVCVAPSVPLSDGEGSTGEEWQRGSSQVSYVLVPRADHEEVFESHEWLLALSAFVDRGLV